jgi:hypothetical protein
LLLGGAKRPAGREAGIGCKSFDPKKRNKSGTAVTESGNIVTADGKYNKPAVILPSTAKTKGTAAETIRIVFPGHISGKDPLAHVEDPYD